MEYDYVTKVADCSPSVRAEFYRRTYSLVALSCAGFGAVLALILSSDALCEWITRLFWGTGFLGILLIMAGFWAASALSTRLAFGGATRSAQLAGLGIYILLEAFLFTPLLTVCFALFGVEEALSTIVVPAAVSTFLLAGGLMATVFMSKRDFSFLRSFVVVGSFVALAAIVVLAIAGAGVPAWFIIAMIALMAGTILYETWAIRTQFSSNQYVGAALLIFSSVITLFYYMILLFLKRRE
ncbi:MAG: Bax inhibitor-1 family protein [Opitutales bacterium]|nr:Bax inhibitor-1 family protein [Opitutales bacterium]